MRLGAHVTGGVKDGLKHAVELRCEAAQIFSQSPRMWRPTDHKPEDLEAFAEERRKLGIPVVIHALYLINLASNDKELRDKSVTALCASCKVAAAIGAESVIFHVGSHMGDGFAKGLERIRPALSSVLEVLDDDVWLLLENTAGAGGTIGRTMDELAAIRDGCDHPRLGICLDSCHLYATGIDVTDAEVMDAFVAEVDDKIGLERLRALHVNDSETRLGSNRDRHANVGEGEMGAGLSVFLSQPKLQSLPCVLEILPHDGLRSQRKYMNALRRLHDSGLEARGLEVPKRQTPVRSSTRKGSSTGSKNSGLRQASRSKRPS
jgi:deoxyribonuclease-4